MQFELCQIQDAQIEPNDRPANRACRRVSALRSEHFQKLVEERAGDEIGDHIDRPAFRRLADRIDKMIVATRHHGLRTDGKNGLLLARARYGNRDRIEHALSWMMAMPTPPDAPVTSAASPAARPARSSTRSVVR